MLNDLLLIERGARQAGIDMVERHPDVKDAGMRPTLRVQLGASGQVTSVDPIPQGLHLWTFGKGNKKRFPFLQISHPLLLPQDEVAKAMLANASRQKAGKRRELVLEFCRCSAFNEIDLKEWPGVRNKNGKWSQEPSDYLNALRERLKEMQGLLGTEGESVLAAIERFLMACDGAKDGGANLLRQVADKLVALLGQSPEAIWLDVAEPLLLQGGGSLFFDVPTDEFTRRVSDPRQVTIISTALRSSARNDDLRGKCSLTGQDNVRMVRDTFPELVVPVIGRTILFSRFDAIPSNSRYDRFGAPSFPIGQSTADLLAATLRSLTSPERKNVTWISIPREATEKRDLLLTFVQGVPDVPVAEALAMDEKEDFSEEEFSTVSGLSRSVADFEKRTERLVKSVQARIHGDFRTTPVRLAVFRSVDPANRKVVYAGSPTVGALYSAAEAWIAGERNVPSWLTVPVFRKGERNPRPMAPPHVAPLGLIAFSKQLYMRGGVERQEVTGLPASEALGLFLDPISNTNPSTRQRAVRVLRQVLIRRGVLIVGAAHALRRGFNHATDFDRREALRTVTILGVLLHKLGRDKEAYMNETAFKLGQLLAAADMVHVGYCADVRGGDTPPSLLGNQVFTMAQGAPAKALAMLCRRWKPYDGWAKRKKWEDAEVMVTSKKKDDQGRGWAIKRALRTAREMGPLAAALAPALEGCRTDDVFRAELLLGYIAGLPKADKVETNDDVQINENTAEEI